MSIHHRAAPRHRRCPCQAHADGYASPVKAEDLKAGDKITFDVSGLTTMTSIPTQGSYRIYSLAGKNMAAGVLSDVMTLNAPNFALSIQFTLTEDAFGPSGTHWLEWGLDVFQKGSGSDEGMCIEVEDIEYAQYEEGKTDPPFEMLCKDNGDGTFSKDTHMIVPKPLPAPDCEKPPVPSCDLKYSYCPRDPGCVGYTMSVTEVEVDVADHDGYKAGDMVHLFVNGTTSLRAIPEHGSFRIYDLAGHNAAAGILSDTLSLYSCDTEGCHFGFDTTFALTTGMFTSQGWFEFGLDVFQQASGSDEGMCIQVMNPTYVEYEQKSGQPPPGFKMYCRDEGWGHFTNLGSPGIDDPVHDAICKLE